MMRTTLNIPDDVYEMVRSLSNLSRISMGDAVAELVRAGRRPPTGIDTGKGFPCFDLPEDAKLISLEHSLEVEDEL